MKTLLAAFGALALAQVASATEIAVSFSDDFATELADNYGEREGPELTEEVTEDLLRAFDHAGVSPARVEVTIIDAKPNRPTFGQLRDQPGLDMMRSISIGGMDLKGTAYDSDGNVLSELRYDWYETDIRDVFGAGTWSDARRASDRFARRFAETLKP